MPPAVGAGGTFIFGLNGYVWLNRVWFVAYTMYRSK